MVDSSSNWARIAILVIVLAALPLVSATKYITTLNGENISIGDSPLFIDNTNSRIGIGTSTPTGALEFNAIQLDSVSQTQNSAYFFINVTPDADNASIDRAGIFSLVQTPTGETNNPGELIGLSGNADHDGSGSAVVTGVEGVAAGSAGTLSTATGVLGDVVTLATTTNARGVVGTVNNFVTTISDARGGQFSVLNTGGTNTEAYGVYIGTVTGSSEWGLYQNDASNNNFFAGSVGIGDDDPARTLEVLDSSNPQLRLTQNEGVDYTDFQTDASGYLVVSPSGSRLGIGTTPSYTFDVDGDGQVQGEFIVHGSAGANEDRITLTTDGSSGVIQAHNGGNYGFLARGVNNAPEIGSFTTGELLIGGFDAQTGGTFSEMARFDLGVDRFGLNNTNPQNTLDVVGTMLVNETTNGAGIEVDGSGNVIITIGGG